MAILLVVLHHAQILPLSAGYLGVDIFFVISGYLITGLIIRTINDGSFSFAEFYFRRAKRLLPAAYVCFLVTTLFAFMLLGPSELRDYLKQLAGAITFTGNIVLWRQAGYFEGDAALKPLLHVWSLSIEEQYYLLLPAALVLLPRRYWLSGAIVVMLASFALCMALVPIKHSAAFYLLPTRGWELAIGSVAALLAFRKEQKLFLLPIAFWPAALTLVLIPVFPVSDRHPGIDALIVCIATAIVVLRSHPSAGEIWGVRTLAMIGDFSYSLYLVHWPIFAFLNNIYLDEPPLAVNFSAIVMSVVLSYGLYRTVELPIRNAQIRVSFKRVGAILAASMILVSTPFLVAKVVVPNEPDHVKSLQTPILGGGCDLENAFPPQTACKTADKPKILIWGDSFASHLIPGVAVTTEVGVELAARAVCGPFINMAPVGSRGFSRSWAERCLEFNQAVLSYLASEKSIEVVVLSSPFGQYLGTELWGHGQKFKSLVLEGNHYAEYEPTIDRAVVVMKRTIAMLRELGKRVVIVAPPPSSGIDMSRCLERQLIGKPIIGIRDADCKIEQGRWRQHHAEVLDFLSRIQEEAAVSVISFEGLLCSDSGCATKLDDIAVYRDAGHFSYEGSILVARKLQLGTLIQMMAR